MAILNKQLKTAEAIYLEQNDLEKALDMYKSFHKWDEGKYELKLYNANDKVRGGGTINHVPFQWHIQKFAQIEIES